MKMKKVLIALFAISLVPNISFAGPKAEVLHWWTSGGEAKALSVLKADFAAKGGVWTDMPVAGGGGDAAMQTLKARIVAGDSPALTVSAEKLGTISDLGRYQSGDPGAQVSRTFEVAQDAGGQWRITNLSDGILLSSGDVDRSFRSFPIYFFNTELTSLVTDNVLVPVSNSGAATSLVRSLLDGPSPYLSPVATSAFPVGTTLTYGSVPITNGIAQVDLSNEILGADEVTRRALSAQLVWTLNVLPNVSAVQISVSGQPLALSNIGALQTIQDWQDLSTLPNSQLQTLNVIRNEEIYSVATDVENLKYIAPASLVFATPNLAGSQIATVTADRKSLQVTNSSESKFEIVAQGNQISKPTWDSEGNIYFSDLGHYVHAQRGS